MSATLDVLEPITPTAAVSPIPFTRKTSFEDSFWYMGHLMTLLAGGEQTGGRFSLIEAWAERGNEPPRHIHRYEDETFYLLEGEATFYVGDEVIHAAPGASVFLPRNVPHSFKIQSDQARVLILLTPSGFEGWFRELGEPAQTLTIPPATEITYADIDRMMALAERYGIEFVPPVE